MSDALPAPQMFTLTESNRSALAERLHREYGRTLPERVVWRYRPLTLQDGHELWNLTLLAIVHKADWPVDREMEQRFVFGMFNRRAKWRRIRLARVAALIDRYRGHLRERPSPRSDAVPTYDAVRELVASMGPMQRRMVDALDAIAHADEWGHDVQDRAAQMAALTRGTFKVQLCLLRKQLAGGLDGIRGPDGRPFDGSRHASGSRGGPIPAGQIERRRDQQRGKRYDLAKEAFSEAVRRLAG